MAKPAPRRVSARVMRAGLLGAALLAGGCRGEPAPPQHQVSTPQTPTGPSAQHSPEAPADAVAHLLLEGEPLCLIFEGDLYLSGPTRLEVEVNADDQSLALQLDPVAFGELGLVALDINLPDQDRVQLADRNWTVISAEPAQVRIGEDAEAQLLTGVRLELMRRLGPSKIAISAGAFVGSLRGSAFIEAYRQKKTALLESWSGKRFTAWVRDALNVRFPARNYLQDGPLCLVREDGGTLGLANFYATYNQRPTPSARQRELDRLMAVEARGPEAQAPLAQAEILAAIKPASYVQSLRRLEAEFSADGQPEQRFVYQPLEGDLWVVYVVDRPDSMASLTAVELRTLGLEQAALPALVAQNLWAAHDTIRVHGDPAEGPFMLSCGGNYEAAMMLVPKLWQALSPMLDGAPVVSVPARDVLVVTGANDHAGIASMRENAQKAGELAYPITTEMFMRHDGRWHLLPEDIGPTVGEA